LLLGLSLKFVHLCNGNNMHAMPPTLLMCRVTIRIVLAFAYDTYCRQFIDMRKDPDVV